MNPAMTSPSAPNLVSCLMADRVAEAAELRQATEVLHLDREMPHRFRRFLTSDARRGGRQVRPAPLAQGQ
jgi:hypothetical protein